MQKFINIGSAPEAGDGDPLRYAFAKCNENFDQLFKVVFSVTDTSIQDHSDSNITGSIAWALSQIASEGGGVIVVGPGEYTTTTSPLVIPANTKIVGSGMDATRIVSLHPGSAIKNQNIHQDEFWSIENLHVSNPETAYGNAIDIIESTNFSVRDIHITGGSAAGWGISIRNSTIFTIERCFIDGYCSGIYVYHSINATGHYGNFGDGLIAASHIHLHSPGTVGIRIAGPDNSNNLINNILVSQCEIAGWSAGSSESNGCTGVHVYNSNRITLMHVDCEILSNCFLHEGKMNGGVGGSYNAFIQCFPIGSNAYVENGIVGETLIIGGHGEMMRYQRIPSDTFSVYTSPSLGYQPVSKIYSDIEHYTQTSVPRVLTLKDSGKTFTNKGASGLIRFNLPPALNAQSMEFHFMLLSSQRIQVALDEGDIFRPGDRLGGIPGAGKVIESNTSVGAGTYLHIKNVDSTVWCITSINGSWTFRA